MTKVNAVHQLLEEMSRQTENLRKILSVQEDKMSKAGLLVESPPTCRSNVLGRASGEQPEENPAVGGRCLRSGTECTAALTAAAP